MKKAEFIEAVSWVYWSSS